MPKVRVRRAVDTARASGHNRAVPSSRLWLLPVLLAVTVLGAFWFGARAKTNDRELPVYVAGAQRMAEGTEVYRAGLDKKPFTYPPFAAVPFLPFRALPEEWQAPVWFVVNFAIVLAIVRWLHSFARRDAPGLAPPRLRWFWVLTVLLGIHHVLSVFANQSHDLLIAGALALAAAAWCRGSAIAGAAAGLGAAIKATPMLFAVLFAARLRILPLFLLGATAVGLSLLPDWWFPRPDGKSWLATWYEVNLRGLEVGGAASGASAWNPHSYLNQSLSGTLTRILTPVVHPDAFVEENAALLHLSPSTCTWIARVLQVLVVALVVFGVRGAARAVRTATDPAGVQRSVGLGEVAAIACGMVLLSPQSSKAHFCVWVFPAAFVADRLLRTRRDLVSWSLLGGALLLGPLSGKDLVGKVIGTTLNVYGNVTWCTVLLLLATVRGLRAPSERPGR